jgi:hypothetical protein
VSSLETTFIEDKMNEALDLFNRLHDEKGFSYSGYLSIRTLEGKIINILEIGRVPKRKSKKYIAKCIKKNQKSIQREGISIDKKNISFSGKSKTINEAIIILFSFKIGLISLDVAKDKKNKYIKLLK